jgi:hypothetical protein
LVEVDDSIFLEAAHSAFVLGGTHTTGSFLAKNERKEKSEFMTYGCRGHLYPPLSRAAMAALSDEERRNFLEICDDQV